MSLPLLLRHSEHKGYTCSQCKQSLTFNGFDTAHFRLVRGMGSNFFLFKGQYRCKSAGCKPVTYDSTNPLLVSQLEPGRQAQFPAMLFSKSAIPSQQMSSASCAAWLHLTRTSRRSTSFSPISTCRSTGVSDYCTHRRARSQNFAYQQPFSLFGDADGYTGMPPSIPMIKKAYVTDFYARLPRMMATQECVPLTDIIKMDHSFKITKRLRINGERIFFMDLYLPRWTRCRRSSKRSSLSLWSCESARHAKALSCASYTQITLPKRLRCCGTCSQACAVNLRLLSIDVRRYRRYRRYRFSP